MDQIGSNWPKNRIFLSFLKFTTLDFADFAYSSSFPLCLTAGLTKRPEKNVKAQNLGLTVPLRPENLFFEIWSIYIVIIYENEALGLEKNKKIFLEFFAIFGPPFSQKKLFLDRKWPKINIRLILSYDPSFFMFRARKNRKKYFWVILTKLGPKFGPKRVILGQNFQKNEKFSKIFFFSI